MIAETGDTPGRSFCLIAAWPGDASVSDSGRLAVELPLGALHWFDAESGARLG